MPFSPEFSLRVAGIGLLLIILALTLLGMIRNTMRDRPSKTTGRGILILVLLIASGALSFLEYQFQSREHTYTEVAKTVGGRNDVHVYCQRLISSSGDYHATDAGVLSTPGASGKSSYAILTNDTCKQLRAYVKNTAKPTLPEVVALDSLARMSIHLGGVSDDATAECYAIQHDYEAALMLGATPTAAKSAVKLYWTDYYRTTQEQFASPNCGSGGSLDLHLSGAPWH